MPLKRFEIGKQEYPRASRSNPSEKIMLHIAKSSKYVIYDIIRKSAKALLPEKTKRSPSFVIFRGESTRWIMKYLLCISGLVE